MPRKFGLSRNLTTVRLYKIKKKVGIPFFATINDEIKEKIHLNAYLNLTRVSSDNDVTRLLTNRRSGSSGSYRHFCF